MFRVHGIYNFAQDTEACPTQRPFFMHFLGLSYPLYGVIMHQVTFVRPMHMWGPHVKKLFYGFKA